MIGRGQIRHEISGGIFFSHVIQGREVTVTLPRELTPALAGLRDPSMVFAGRGTDLAALLSLLDPATQPPAPRTVQVTGLPGVGKTELALHAAQAALRSGWFPGGVLFTDMQGYAREGQLDAATALASMLRATGIPDDHIPASLPDRMALLTSVLAAYAGQGRPVLLVIDNASTAAQVTPIIPADGKVLVTSRHTLPLRNARRLELRTLTDDAAAELIAAELDLSGGNDPRVAAQREDARAIARLCDGLPLALHVVSALLAAHPSRPLSSMAADLHGARDRLDEMRYPGADGEELAVRSAFDLSYDQLNPEQARLFRLMALGLGPEISAEAVSAMASCDLKAAQGLLMELERAHLIQPGTEFGRWRMHELIRLYARQLDDGTADRARAFGLLLLYYLDRAREAAGQLEPTSRHDPGSSFTDRAQALAWLDTEYPNLIPYAHVVVAEPASARPLTADLALMLWRYLELRHQTDDWIRLTVHALNIARALGDRRREANALANLGGAFRQARRFGEAIDACRESARLQRELGDRHGEGIALNNLSAAQTEAAQPHDAVSSAREAAAAFRETADLHREGVALAHLGGALAGLERFDESAQEYEKALRAFRASGDQHGTGITLANMGSALRAAGQRTSEALAAQRAAVQIMRDTDDRHGTVIALAGLAETLRKASQAEEATAAAREALELAGKLDDARLEGLALNSLGLAQRAAGELDLAVATLTRAAGAFGRGEDLASASSARNNQGSVLLEANRPAEAIDCYRQAVATSREAGDWAGEGTALWNLASAQWQARGPAEAVPALRAARSAFHDAGDRIRAADCQVFLGTVLGFARMDETLSAYQEALSVYQQSGSSRQFRLQGMIRAFEDAKQTLDAHRDQLAAGHYEEVITGFRQMATAARKMGDHYGEGVMSAALGAALRGAGRFGEAADVLRAAADALAAAGDPDRARAARDELDAALRDQSGAQAAAQRLGALLAAGTGEDAGELRDAADAALRYLGPHDARLFRLLSACPGPDVGTEAATLLMVADQTTVRARAKELADTATRRKSWRLYRRIIFLYGQEAAAAGSALATLARMRLVEHDPVRPERWRLPDALRPYAAQQAARHAAQDLNGQVRKLLLIYYFAGTNAASIHLDHSADFPAGAGFPDKDQAIGWLDAEYPSLLATVHAAAARTDKLGAVITLDMTRALTHITTLRGRSEDAIVMGELAVRAARHLKNLPAEAVLRNLGGDLLRSGRSEEAISTLGAALEAYRKAGDRVGEGTTLTNLGIAITAAGRPGEAAGMLRAAVEVHRRLRRSYSEAIALGDLGIALTVTNQPDEAVASLKAADAIFRRLGEHHARASVLVTLAGVLEATGHEDEAARTYHRALSLAWAVNDEALAGRVLARLTATQRVGTLDEGADAAEPEEVTGTTGSPGPPAAGEGL